MSTVADKIPPLEERRSRLTLEEWDKLEKLEIESLPELTKDQIEFARNAKNKEWIYYQLTTFSPGYSWRDGGLCLQVLSDGLRLLSVVEHEYYFGIVAQIRETIEFQGLRLDLSNAVVIPYEEMEEESLN